MLRKAQKIFITLIFCVFTAAVFYVFSAKNEPVWGVTFSDYYARELGLNPEETFSALINDLGVRNFRLPVYWDAVESERGVYNFENLDKFLEIAESAGAKVTIVIGQKVPRWPECFIPDWAKDLGNEEYTLALENYIATVVYRTRQNSSVIRYQIENEPFLAFGKCPSISPLTLAKEINAARGATRLPIQMTASGELEPWVLNALKADVLGVSLYRNTWNKTTGFSFYPFSPLFYRIRGIAISMSVEKIIISELQAEPWFSKPVSVFIPENYYKLFDSQALLNNAEFARKTGFDEIYFWGAEWWYFLKQNGDNRLWETAGGFFN